MNIKNYLLLAFISISSFLPIQTLAWFKSRATITGGGSISVNGKTITSIGNNPITIINGVVLTEKDITPIKLTGKIVERTLDTPVEEIAVENFIAKTHIINLKERPRIECDEAAANIIFNVVHGKLTATSKDNQPLLFDTNGQPLCTIYAHLLGNTLKASNHASVLLQDQDLRNISVNTHATVSGSVKNIESLNITADTHGEANIKNINNNCTNIIATAHGKITASGITKEQNIEVSTHAQYNGLSLKTDNAHINATTHASAHLKINKELNGQVSTHAEVKNRGTACNNNVRTSTFGKCQ
jgi:hypothetical protein